MDYATIRRIALIAIASDDLLSELLVLKGGNALDLIHKLGNRSSLDLDFSMSEDAESLETLDRHLRRSIRDRFGLAGFQVFDESLEFRLRPRSGIVPDWWGGYVFRFKIISNEKFRELGDDLEALRRNAVAIDPQHHRSLEIQISRSEFCDGSELHQVDGFDLRVYSLVMIACEKLRAICQQHEDYELNGGATNAPRARDFYDLYVLTEEAGVDLASGESIAILEAMFAAKHVPISILHRLEQTREFHRQDWPRVVDYVRGPVADFDIYFDHTLDLVSRLQARGVV